MFSDDRYSTIVRQGCPARRRGLVCWHWPTPTRLALGGLIVIVGLALAMAGKPVPPAADAVVRAPMLMLDLNTAPPYVLETLPHVGPTLVRQLVAARKVRPFESLADAASRVKGLGPATCARIAHYVCFTPVERPSPEDLLEVPAARVAARSRSKKRKVSVQAHSIENSPSLLPQLVSRSSN